MNYITVDENTQQSLTFTHKYYFPLKYNSGLQFPTQYAEAHYFRKVRAGIERYSFSPLVGFFLRDYTRKNAQQGFNSRRKLSQSFLPA